MAIARGQSARNSADTKFHEVLTKFHEALRGARQADISVVVQHLSTKPKRIEFRLKMAQADGLFLGA